MQEGRRSPVRKGNMRLERKRRPWAVQKKVGPVGPLGRVAGDDVWSRARAE